MGAPVLRGRAKLDTGFRPSPTDIRDIRYGLVANPTLDVPEAFAFETPKRTLPVYNQGPVPKCVASACALLKTTQEVVEGGKLLLFDDDELYKHIELPGGGANIRTGLQRLVDVGMKPTTMTRPKKIKLYAAIDPKNHDEVKHAMVQAGSLVVGMEVTRGFCKGGGKEFHADAGGNENDVVGAHAIDANFYTPDGPGLHNSWGEDWADGGKTQVSWEFWDKYVFECWTSVDTSDDEVQERIEKRGLLNIFGPPA